MTTTGGIYRGELAKTNADAWAARTIEVLLLDQTSTYVFDPTDVYVDDVFASGGIEGFFLSYVRQTVTLSTATIDGSERWQLLASTADFGIIGTGASDETGGAIFYEPVTTDADSPLIAAALWSPTVDVWDGSTAFRLTIPSTGLMRVSSA